VPRGSVTGTVTWTVTGSGDPVDAIWLQVDGVTQAYTSPVTWPVTLNYDTSTLVEGAHTFAVVTDGDAGVLARRTWPLTVDRTPPAAPVPVGPVAITTERSSVMLRWTRPVGETDGRVEGKVCDAAGCRAFENNRDALHLPLASGVTTVSVWLRDAAGNADPARAATWTITRAAPAPAARIIPGSRSCRPHRTRTGARSRSPDG
jgi:hypothetical protein